MNSYFEVKFFWKVFVTLLVITDRRINRVVTRKAGRHGSAH